MSVQGKIVLISGASSGIGAACAGAFAKAGAKLILASRNLANLKEIAAGLEQQYQTEYLLCRLDVRDRKAVAGAIAGLPASWRRIDILINNAGLALGMDKLYRDDVDDWETMIDTNIKGLLYLTRQVVPLMIEQEIAGHIINIGSIAGIQSYPNGTVYCATKAAVKMLSDGLRMDIVDLPIRVTNIQPGLVESNFNLVRFKGDADRSANYYKGIKPLAGADVADIALYAASAPPHVQICEVTVTPTHQASVLVTYKEN